jgi:hypothetical protein
VGDPASVHQSGLTAAEEAARDASVESDKPIDIPDEPSPRFRTPGFHRMRLNWNGPEAHLLYGAQQAVGERILETFRDAYDVMNSVYEVVRTPVIDPVTEEPERDSFGFVVWKQSVSGSYEEDFTKLTKRERDHFLLLITTRAFAWEQYAADAWAEAMFAKALWEERYAIDYSKVMASRATMGDREAMAAEGAADERYFAVFVSYYSRKADAIVRTMNNLAARLRDTLMV